MTTQRHILVSLFALLALLCLPSLTLAQEAATVVDTTHLVIADSLHRVVAADLHALTKSANLTDNADSAKITNVHKSAFTRRQQRQQRLSTFTPDPNKATWSAIVFPGGGQIYNRKYWKLPIVYGGFVGCTYALNWNNKMYKDYSQAYLDIMDDDPNTKSYEDFLPMNSSIAGQEERFKEIFRKRKDIYRRQRDLSILCFIGVYLLSVIDAYVDAELSDFDITKDIGLKIEPAVFNDAKSKNFGSVGLQCSLKF